MGDDPNARPLRWFDDTGPEWAGLPPWYRAALNRLRRARHLPLLAEPPADLPVERVRVESKQHGKSYEEINWAKLSPIARHAHNRLRQMRGLEPIPAPEGDLWKPSPPSEIRKFDPTDEEAVAAAQQFLGARLEGDEGFEEKPGAPVVAAKDTNPKLLDYSNPLARAIVRSDDPEEVDALLPELAAADDALLGARDGDSRALAARARRGTMTSEEHALAADLLEGKVKWPAHGSKTLSRGIGEHVTEVFLRTWDRLAPQDRWSRKRVLSRIWDAYGISRSEALKLLAKVRKREKHG